MIGPMHDMGRSIVILLGEFNEGIASFRVIWRLDVLHPPIGMKVLHFRRRLGSARTKSKALLRVVAFL